jgi:hydrogenase 3 maturation protease
MALDENLLAQLKTLKRRRAVIVGIGNSLKADDGAGPAVCANLKDLPAAPVIDASMTPENYIGRILACRPELVLIVDAVDFGAQPGAISIFSPEAFSYLTSTTHAVSLRLLADVIGRQIPTVVRVLGIQPGCSTLGRPLSPEVARAVRIVADCLAEVFGDVPEQHPQ